jgi:hypothetical protein
MKFDEAVNKVDATPPERVGIVEGQDLSVLVPPAACAIITAVCRAEHMQDFSRIEGDAEGRCLKCKRKLRSNDPKNRCHCNDKVK